MSFEQTKAYIKRFEGNPLSTPLIYILFAMLCFITALMLHAVNKDSLSETLPAQGGLVGPLEVSQDLSVYQVDISQSVPDGQWSYVSADLLDQQKTFLFSFGKEFWSESGYDSDGRWQESDVKSSGKITIQKAGTYYLRIKTEASPLVTSQIKVGITGKTGSSLPHTIAGVIALIIGVGLYFVRSQSQGSSQSFDRLQS